AGRFARRHPQSDRRGLPAPAGVRRDIAQRSVLRLARVGATAATLRLLPAELRSAVAGPIGHDVDRRASGRGAPTRALAPDRGRLRLLTPEAHSASYQTRINWCHRLDISPPMCRA